jgi:hypothetical protein
MIHHIQGNLLISDCRYIIHQSNCHGGFGSGIAGQIRKIYPRAYESFIKDVRTPKCKLGSYSFALDTHMLNNNLEKYIFNMYGQFYYGADPNVVYTDYAAFERGLNDCIINIKFLITDFPEKGNKIGMPYLVGCGLANGDWSTVYGIIEKISQRHNVDIYLYEFTP